MTKAVIIACPGLALANGDENNFFGYDTDTTTEANALVAASDAVTFSNVRANIISGGSGTNNFQFRKNGANGNGLASRSGTGVAEDAVNTDTLAAADTYNIAYTDTGTDSTLSWMACNIEFSSGYGCFHACASYNGSVCDAASSTRVFGLGGGVVADGALTTSEDNHAWKTRAYDSYDALTVTITSNARTNNSIFTNRIAKAAGTGSITVGSGLTGIFSDTGIGDAITDGQVLSAGITLDTGVEDLVVALIVATLKSSTIKQDVFTVRTLTRAADATAHYLPLGGRPPLLTSFTETQARCKIGYAGTASNLRCYLSANTYGGAATLKLFQNGSAVITTTIGAGGGAAWYENTSDTISFDADDELSVEFDEGTSGSATIEMWGLTLAPTAAITGPLIGGSHLLTNGPLISGRLIQ